LFSRLIIPCDAVSRPVEKSVKDSENRQKNAVVHCWMSQTGTPVPPDVEAVILRCLSKERAQRFQTAAALGEALAACSAAGHWTSAEAARWWQAHSANGRLSG
jgi:hypothetical protein